MAHNRKLVLGIVSLTLAKVRPHRWLAAAAGRVRDDLEHEMMSSGFLEGAPFRWVGLIIRTGLVDEQAPHYFKIDQADGELPVAIEIDVHRLLGASEEAMVAVIRKATLLALLHVGAKYDLSNQRMGALLAELTHSTS